MQCTNSTARSIDNAVGSASLNIASTPTASSLRADPNDASGRPDGPAKALIIGLSAGLCFTFIGIAIVFVIGAEHKKAQRSRPG